MTVIRTRIGQGALVLIVLHVFRSAVFSRLHVPKSLLCHQRKQPRHHTVSLILHESVTPAVCISSCITDRSTG